MPLSEKLVRLPAEKIENKSVYLHRELIATAMMERYEYYTGILQFRIFFGGGEG